MSVHGTYERLVLTSLDFPISARDEARLREHLRGCEACRKLADAYRADAEGLESIALADAPERVRMAVHAAATEAAPRRPTWQLLLVAALLTLALGGLAVAAGALLQRAPDAPLRVELPTWIEGGDWWITDVVGLDDGWFVGAGGQHGTRLLAFGPERRWALERPGASTEFVSLSDVERLAGSDLIAIGLVQQERGVVLVRRNGTWSRVDALDTVTVRDAATAGDRVWIVGRRAYAPEDRLVLAVGSAGGDFKVLDIQVPVLAVSARVAVAGDRIVIGGCVPAGEGCDLAVYGAAADGSDWTPTRLPGPAAAHDGPAEPQLLADDDGFLALASTRVEGAGIWSSIDGRTWEHAASFPADGHPSVLAGDGIRRIAVGTVSGLLTLWIPHPTDGWRQLSTSVPLNEVVAASIAGDRLLVLGTDGTTTQAWELEVPVP